MGPTDDANSEVDSGLTTPAPSAAPGADSSTDSGKTASSEQAASSKGTTESSKTTVPDQSANSNPATIRETQPEATKAPATSTQSESDVTPASDVAPKKDVATEQSSAETPDPVIASTVTIPAGNSGEGGEWNLLQEKIQDWVSANNLSALWEQFKLPAQILAALIVLILVLQIYSGILRTIAAVPLAPGLLELAGIFAVANFSVRRLIKSSERKKVLQSVRERWTQFVGR